LNTLIGKTSELKKITADISDVDATDIEDALAYLEYKYKQIILCACSCP
jgi:hypothetical protein